MCSTKCFTEEHCDKFFGFDEYSFGIEHNGKALRLQKHGKRAWRLYNNDAKWKIRNDGIAATEYHAIEKVGIFKYALENTGKGYLAWDRSASDYIEQYYVYDWNTGARETIYTKSWGFWLNRGPEQNIGVISYVQEMLENNKIPYSVIRQRYSDLLRNGYIRKINIPIYGDNHTIEGFIITQKGHDLIRKWPNKNKNGKHEIDSNEKVRIAARLKVNLEIIRNAQQKACS